MIPPSVIIPAAVLNVYVGPPVSQSATTNGVLELRFHQHVVSPVAVRAASDVETPWRRCLGLNALTALASSAISVTTPSTLEVSSRPRLAGQNEQKVLPVAPSLVLQSLYPSRSVALVSRDVFDGLPWIRLPTI